MDSDPKNRRSEKGLWFAMVALVFGATLLIILALPGTRIRPAGEAPPAVRKDKASITAPPSTNTFSGTNQIPSRPD